MAVEEIYYCEPPCPECPHCTGCNGSEVRGGPYGCTCDDDDAYYTDGDFADYEWA